MKGLHRNSLGLDLKPTTKLILELEYIALFNQNQFKGTVHKKHDHWHEGMMSKTLAPSLHPKKQRS